MGLSFKYLALALVASAVVAHVDDDHHDDDFDDSSFTPTSWPTRTNSLIPFPVTLSPTGSPNASPSVHPTGCSWHCTPEDEEQGACLACDRGHKIVATKVAKKIRAWLHKQALYGAGEANAPDAMQYMSIPDGLPSGSAHRSRKHKGAWRHGRWLQAGIESVMSWWSGGEEAAQEDGNSANAEAQQQ